MGEETKLVRETIENKYGSRKFIVTTLGLLGTFALAAAKLMTADVAIVVAAAIGSYNWANSRVSK